MKYETFCPLFPGFYGTWLEYDGEEYDIEEYNRENGTTLDWDGFNWGYADYYKRVSNAFVIWIERELKQYLPNIKIEFEELRSPKEYNFYNDSINVKISLNLGNLLNLIKERKERAAEYFRDKYTSRSGFISFHSPYLSDWLQRAYIMENPGHRIGALLDCLCNIEGLKYEDYDNGSENYIDFSPKELIPVNN